MLYQLPSGRVIHLSIEQYLDLSDDDIQQLMAQNAGDYVRNPFYKSAISKSKKAVEDPEDELEEESIDYTPDTDEIASEQPIIQEETDLQDFPDISDEDLIL